MADRETDVSALAGELGVTRQTLYRHVGPGSELRPDGQKAAALVLPCNGRTIIIEGRRLRGLTRGANRRKKMAVARTVSQSAPAISKAPCP
jgi:hypothetical protein